MARRLAGEVAGAGIRGEALFQVLEAYRLAMVPRMERLVGDDPAFLHPARSALILLADVGGATPSVLAASILVESEEAELRAGAERVEEVLGRAVAEVLESVPSSGPGLLPRLLAADEDARLITLAERLDQVRHVHLRSPGALRRMHRQTRDIYLPVASRTHRTLERRFRRWYDATAERAGIGDEPGHR